MSNHRKQPVPTEIAKTRIREWFYNPKTPEFAWKELSWREIARLCEVSLTQARSHLPPLVENKYRMTRRQMNKARYASAVVQNKKGVKRPPNEIQQIKEARKTSTIEEVAQEFGLSPITIQRHSGKKRRKKRKK